MDERKSFVLYTEYKQYIELLNDEDCGKLLKSLFDYIESKNIPEFEGSLKMAFLVIKNQLDRDNEKYVKKCKTNKENGSKGGRPRKNNTSEDEETKKPNGFSEKPNKTERLFSETDQNPTKPLMSNDYMSNDNEDDNDINNIYAQKNCACEFFDDLWALYPRKRGKASVSKKALQEINTVGFEKMSKAIANYKADIERSNTAEQYIMYGSTFFNGGYKDWLEVRSDGPEIYSDEYMASFGIEIAGREKPPMRRQ